MPEIWDEFNFLSVQIFVAKKKTDEKKLFEKVCFSCCHETTNKKEKNISPAQDWENAERIK